MGRTLLSLVSTCLSLVESNWATSDTSGSSSGRSSARSSEEYTHKDMKLVTRYSMSAVPLCLSQGLAEIVFHETRSLHLVTNKFYKTVCFPNL